MNCFNSCSRPTQFEGASSQGANKDADSGGDVGGECGGDVEGDFVDFGTGIGVIDVFLFVE